MKPIRILLVVAVLVCGTALSVARELPVAAPALVGLSDARLERISAAIESAIEEQQVAGAVAIVVRRGDVAYHQAFGMADRDSQRSVRSDDLFRIASMSKAITSTAVMMLFEEGHFLLDDPIGKYLSEFDYDMQVAIATDDTYTLVDAERQMTIRHLLTHTSGLSYRFMNTQPLTDLYAEAGISDGLGDAEHDLEENVRRLAAMPLAHQPGEAWSYGLNSDVLGRLIEVVSGKPLDQFFAERIFLPLDMLDTHFQVPDAKHARMTTVYRNVDGSLQAIAAGVVSDGPVRFNVDYPYSPTHSLFSGGAGLTSTARDYARFLQMLLNGGTLDDTRLLGRKTVELMSSDQTTGLDGAGFGSGGFSLGFAIDGGPAESGNIGSRGSLSWGGFFNTFFWIDPEEQLVAVLLTQHYPFGIELQQKFRVLVYQAIVD